MAIVGVKGLIIVTACCVLTLLTWLVIVALLSDCVSWIQRQRWWWYRVHSISVLCCQTQFSWSH